MVLTAISFSSVDCRSEVGLAGDHLLDHRISLHITEKARVETGARKAGKRADAVLSVLKVSQTRSALSPAIIVLSQLPLVHNLPTPRPGRRDIVLLRFVASERNSWLRQRASRPLTSPQSLRRLVAVLPHAR